MIVVCVRYSVISLVVLLFLSLSWSVQSNPLKIYVHIGAHKTGSTHIQTYVEANWENLEKENICIPSATHSAKNFASLAGAFASFPIEKLQDMPEFKEIQNCLQKKMNVVLSTENFSTLNADKVVALKNWLVKAAEGHEVEVKIILYYREWLNYVYSVYFELQKQYQTGVTTFSEHFAMNNITTEVNSYEFKAQNYIKAFGEENMIIVDYYGVQASNKDIAYVFVCEIMGVYCHQAAELNNGKASQENSHLDLVYLHYIYLLDLYLNSHLMRRCVLDVKFIYWEISGLAGRKIQFPTKVSHFDFFRELAIQRDLDFRETYKKNFLYGNRDANVQKIHDFHVDEMDVIAFYKDPKWIVFMRDETARYIKQGVICALDDVQIKIGTDELWKLKIHGSHHEQKKPHGT
jgi:hypothetical protein